MFSITAVSSPFHTQHYYTALGAQGHQNESTTFMSLEWALCSHVISAVCECSDVLQDDEESMQTMTQCIYVQWLCIICEQRCSWMDDAIIIIITILSKLLNIRGFPFLQNNAGNSSSTQTYTAGIPKRFFIWFWFKKDWECVKKKMPENFMEMETKKTKFWVCVSQLSCTTNTPVPPLNHMWTHKYMTTYKWH